MCRPDLERNARMVCEELRLMNSTYSTLCDTLTGLIMTIRNGFALHSKLPVMKRFYVSCNGILFGQNVAVS